MIGLHKHQWYLDIYPMTDK